MILRDFNTLMNKRISKIKSTLLLKGKEYGRKDRLHNFKTAARMDEGETPERALKGMWKKHLISIFDMIDDLDTYNLPTQALIDAKIGDGINYLILLEALLTERLKES